MRIWKLYATVSCPKQTTVLSEGESELICVTVKIFGDESKKSKFDSWGNKEEIELGPDPSVFLSAVKKREN
jgi:hypothetical protein